MWGGTLHRYTAAAAAPSGARATTTPTARAAKHGKSAATPQEQPPPPTVAPPPPGARKPKERSAFRQRRKSDGQRQEEQVALAAAQSAAGAGRQVFLDQTALAQRAAAVAASHPRANNQQQQAPHMWCDAVLAPLLELLPELRTALSRGHIPRVLVLDAYNLLHAHPSTKALLQDGLLHRARALLQLVVKEYAAEQHAYVVLVYDAVSLRAPQLTPGARRQRSSSSSSSGSGSAATSGTFTATSSSSGATRRVSVLSGRVSAVYEVGTEADTVIIHLVQELLDREAAAAAAGQLGPASGGPLVSVAVHTNDLRIQAACSDASMAAGARLVHHALSVACHSQGPLSNALTRVEQRHHPSLREDGAIETILRQQRLHLSPAGAPGSSDPLTDTVAWAESLLAPGRAASRRRQEEHDEQQQQQVSGRRRRRQRQAAAEQEVQLQQQQVLAAGLDDEQLLQAAASTGLKSRPAAAWADTATEPSLPVASSSSSSAVLDELLSLDLGSL